MTIEQAIEIAKRDRDLICFDTFTGEYNPPSDMNKESYDMLKVAIKCMEKEAKSLNKKCCKSCAKYDLCPYACEWNDNCIDWSE